MAVALRDLPRFLVLDPLSTVRVEMMLDSPACEIDATLDNPRPGRSFILLIGHKDGPYVQRVRLAGKARLYFDPQSPGEYVLLFANPQKEPIVLRLRARAVGAVPATRTSERRRGRSKRVPAAPSGPSVRRSPAKARGSGPSSSSRR